MAKRRAAAIAVCLVVLVGRFQRLGLGASSALEQHNPNLGTRGGATQVDTETN